jgi:Antitoxin-like ribbon-helix-helix
MAKRAPRKPDETGGGPKAILTRVNAEGLKALRLLALERDTTLQAIAIEAFNDVLKKHGKKAAVRNPLID